ncbi:MAG: hypothetical protein MJZ61_09895, partial [Bacteroidales bacterium]|nr:hypothetical protein [Bacteroidales bacterium]
MNAEGRATIEMFASEATHNYLRLIIGNSKLPMIVHKGENVEVVINLDDIHKSRISGSPESEYLNRGLCADGKGLCRIIRKNPDCLANVFLVGCLDFDKYFGIYKLVADRFKDEDMPAARDLYDRVYARKRIEDELNKPEYKAYDAISFWASWNRRSVDFLEKYVLEHSGSRILAVSMDGDRELYGSTISKLGIASDAIVNLRCEFNYFDNDCARIFRVTELPMLI